MFSMVNVKYCTMVYVYFISPIFLQQTPLHSYQVGLMNGSQSNLTEIVPKYPLPGYIWMYTHFYLHSPQSDSIDVIVFNEDTMFGLASKLELVCTECDNVVFSKFTSPRVSSGRSFDINNQFTYACKTEGLGYEQASGFLAQLELPPAISDTVFTQKLHDLNKSCEAAFAEH